MQKPRKARKTPSAASARTPPVRTANGAGIRAAKQPARKAVKPPGKPPGRKTAPQSLKAAPSKRRPRSRATRQEIIDAAINCFIEIGYVRTTTTEIAQMSGYTRGAVQYYFPTTRHVLKASINYLIKQWLESYMDAVANAPPGTDSIDYAVDTLWRFVNDRLFVAWQELVYASRTDKELRKIIMPAAAKFEQVRRERGQASYADFHEAGMAKFERNRDTLRFVLEGISSTILTYEKDQRIEAQLNWLKEWFHASWAQKEQKEERKTRKART